MSLKKERCERGVPICKECAGYMYTMALQVFKCKKCGLHYTARHGGNWHYCDVCAQKFSRCAMCGKKLS